MQNRKKAVALNYDGANAPIVTAVGMGIIVYGILAHGWYMDEISGVFLAMGILMGIVGGLSEKEIAEQFVIGVKDLAFAAVVIGVCRGILVVAENGMIIDTILNYLSGALAGVGSAAFVAVMYLVQSLLSLLVPSSSALASLTMPIMAPLSDLLGVSRQTAVVAFQLGDAFTNLIVPTSGCLIGSLAIAKIEWSNWIKFMWKFLGVLMIGAIITVLVAVGIGF